MSKGILTALEIIAGLVMLLVIIGVAMNMTNQAKDAAQDMSSEITGMVDTAATSKYTAFEGRDNVMGSEIISFITSNQNDDIRVQITNLGGNTYYYIEGSNYSRNDTDVISVSDMKKKSAAGYINPSGVFAAELIRDTNSDVITDIVFTQQ